MRGCSTVLVKGQGVTGSFVFLRFRLKYRSGSFDAILEIVLTAPPPTHTHQVPEVPSAILHTYTNGIGSWRASGFFETTASPGRGNSTGLGKRRCVSTLKLSYQPQAGHFLCLFPLI